MNATYSENQNFGGMLQRMNLRRGLTFGIIIVTALLAFELFNYSTTDFALTDLLGDLKFAGVRWATILAIAFCGIDFAGIARLFTPESGENEVTEVWYLFGAWLLAATMNAMLTWWGVSIAILNQESLGSAVIERETMLRVVPIFVAVMVWLIRVLIIGSFSVAGERLFSQAENGLRKERIERVERTPVRPAQQPVAAPAPLRAESHNPTPKVPPVHRPAPKSMQGNGYTRPEPTYHPASMSGSNGNGSAQHSPLNPRR